jgi:methylenetetrahydrofolate reductase (NADPH)
MLAQDQLSSQRLVRLLAAASVEISSRGHQLAELRDNFAPGTSVSITFLPGDNYHHNVETAAALRRAGFNPIPHLAAREIASREALADFLVRLRGEADVTSLLLIAGDVLAAKGPFKASRDIADTGLIEQHGFARVSVAGHPEGHPYLDPTGVLKLLLGWQDWSDRRGVPINIVTQFCFESAPILHWLWQLRAHGVLLPVTIGLAGPATPATLVKFALRCGVGNSLRAARNRIGRYGRLMTETGPDEVVCGLADAPLADTQAITGFHLFPFGGLRKAAFWLHDDKADGTRAPLAGPGARKS